jgi:hypothetical protein
MGAGHQFAVADFPVKALGCDLYHKRRRIEESYKRLKHHAKLESVSGQTQHAVLIDVYAKVLADNLNALVCMGASDDAELAANNRSCNRGICGGLPVAGAAKTCDGAGVSGDFAGKGV